MTINVFGQGNQIEQGVKKQEIFTPSKENCLEAGQYP